MQREYAVRQLAKRNGYRLEKKSEQTYRLISQRFNVVVHGLDGVPLERVRFFLEHPEARAHSDRR
jgi:hypothetical protein